MSRRAFASAAIGAVAVVAAPGLRAQARPEKARVSLAVDGKSGLYFLPLTIAEQLGYFKSEGIELAITDFAGGARALQSLMGGSADVVAGAYEHTISMQSRNQFIRSVVLQGRAPQIAFGVSSRNLPNYKSLADLKGKKIGVSAPGSSTNMVVNLILARAGLKPGDVTFVGVGTSVEALAALRSGRIDAMSNVDPVMTMLEQRGEVRIISDTRTLKGTVEVFGGQMPAACLYSRSEFVEKHPVTCQALTNAIVHALKWLQTAGPSDIIKTVPEAYLLGDRALYLASFEKVREAISPDGMFPDEGARTALKALSSFDPAVKAAKIDLPRTYTNEFARKAKERFRA